MRTVTSDELHTFLAGEYAVISNHLQNILDRFTGILHTIPAKQIMAGETAQAIDTFTATVEEQGRGQYKDILITMSESTTGYINEISYADRYTDIDGVTHQSN